MSTTGQTVAQIALYALILVLWIILLAGRRRVSPYSGPGRRSPQAPADHEKKGEPLGFSAPLIDRRPDTIPNHHIHNEP